MFSQGVRVGLVSFYGIYSLVFIVETARRTQWPATGEGCRVLGSSAVAELNGGSERGTEQLRAVSHERERTPPPQIQGLDPPPPPLGVKAISNDG